MNKLINGLSQVRITTNCLSTRGYAFKSDLKIKWVRPERILCIKPQKSGDQSAFPQLDKSQYLLEYQNSEELKTLVDSAPKESVCFVKNRYLLFLGPTNMFNVSSSWVLIAAGNRLSFIPRNWWTL